MGCLRREEAISSAEGLDAIYSGRGSVKDSCAHLGATVEFWQRIYEALKFSEGGCKGDLVVCHAI